jgi:phosphatidylserine/phosphatidylglycerophosphate/cardiolipin synthase-like enzyme
VKQISSREAVAEPFELTPVGAPFLIHSKTLVRDNRDSVVGSFNLDPRSYSTNLEGAVIVKNCPEFAADVSGQFQRLKFVYDQDAKAGKLPEIESIGAAAIILATLGIMLL